MQTVQGLLKLLSHDTSRHLAILQTVQHRKKVLTLLGAECIIE
jgi:hypothetical protein